MRVSNPPSHPCRNPRLKIPLFLQRAFSPLAIYVYIYIYTHTHIIPRVLANCWCRWAKQGAKLGMSLLRLVQVGLNILLKVVETESLVRSDASLLDHHSGSICPLCPDSIQFSPLPAGIRMPVPPTPLSSIIDTLSSDRRSGPLGHTPLDLHSSPLGHRRTHSPRSSDTLSSIITPVH